MAEQVMEMTHLLDSSPGQVQPATCVEYIHDENERCLPSDENYRLYYLSGRQSVVRSHAYPATSQTNLPSWKWQLAEK